MDGRADPLQIRHTLDRLSGTGRSGQDGRSKGGNGGQERRPFGGKSLGHLLDNANPLAAGDERRDSASFVAAFFELLRL